MAQSATKENGTLTKCTERGITFGLMVAFTKASGFLIAAQAKGSNVCPMVLNTKATL